MARHYMSEERQNLERNLVGGFLGCSQREPELAGDALALVAGSGVKSCELAEIWQAVESLHRDSMRVDLVSVFNVLHERWLNGKGAEIDAGTLADLSANVFANRDAVLFHAEALNAMNRREELNRVLSAAAGECLIHGSDPDSIAAKAIAEIESVKMPQAGSTLDELLDGILADVESGEGSRPLMTPWTNLNNVLKGGTAPGELVVLAGRPGLGKTAFAGCMAVETARSVGPVLFVSCEVKDKTIGARLLAREGQIDNRAFRQGLNTAANQLPKILRARQSLAGVPLKIVDSSNRVVRPAEVRKLARQMKDGPALVVVDYLQLMYPDEKCNSREQEIAGMSRAMKRLAVELNCPVWLLSQLNRKVEDGGRKPELSDLRESGAVEQDADIVMMLHTERKNQSLTRTPVEVLVRKGRSSGTGTAYMIFDKPYADFIVDERSEGWRDSFRQPQRVANDL